MLRLTLSTLLLARTGPGHYHWATAGTSRSVTDIGALAPSHSRTRRQCADVIAMLYFSGNPRANHASAISLVEDELRDGVPTGAAADGLGVKMLPGQLGRVTAADQDSDGLVNVSGCL